MSRSDLWPPCASDKGLLLKSSQRYFWGQWGMTAKQRSFCCGAYRKPSLSNQPGGWVELENKDRTVTAPFFGGENRKWWESSKRGTLIKRQCLSFTTIPPLQCAVMQWCIALHGATKAFIPTLLHVSRFYSQLNAHWNKGKEVPHWALHNVGRRTDERTCLLKSA